MAAAAGARGGGVGGVAGGGSLVGVTRVSGPAALAAAAGGGLSGIGGQSNIVSVRPRRLAYGRRIRCMRRRVIVDLASAGPLEVKFIITLRRSTPVIEYRRFELGPPGESKLPLSNRKYTDFFENSQ